MGTNWYFVNSAVVSDPTVVEDTACGGSMHQVPLEDIVAAAVKVYMHDLSLPCFGQTFH